jgi:hypothetical protein
MHYLFRLLIISGVWFITATAFGARDQFRGQWLASSPTPFRTLEIDRQFNLDVQDLGRGHLTTYGTGIGHPNSHVGAMAVIDQGGSQYTLVFYLGGILTTGRNPDILDVVFYEDQGYNLDYGNNVKRIRYKRAIF